MFGNDVDLQPTMHIPHLTHSRTLDPIDTLHNLHAQNI